MVCKPEKFAAVIRFYEKNQQAERNVTFDSLISQVLPSFQNS